jgi:hypothetical protein
MTNVRGLRYRIWLPDHVRFAPELSLLIWGCRCKPEWAAALTERNPDPLFFAPDDAARYVYAVCLEN